MNVAARGVYTSRDELPRARRCQEGRALTKRALGLFVLHRTEITFRHSTKVFPEERVSHKRHQRFVDTCRLQAVTQEMTSLLDRQDERFTQGRLFSEMTFEEQENYLETCEQLRRLGEELLADRVHPLV